MEAWFADFLLTETNAHSSSRLLIESETDSSKTSPYILVSDATLSQNTRNIATIDVVFVSHGPQSLYLES